MCLCCNISCSSLLLQQFREEDLPISIVRRSVSVRTRRNFVESSSIICDSTGEFMTVVDILPNTDDDTIENSYASLRRATVLDESGHWEDYVPQTPAPILARTTTSPFSPFSQSNSIKSKALKITRSDGDPIREKLLPNNGHNEDFEYQSYNTESYPVTSKSMPILQLSSSQGNSPTDVSPASARFSKTTLTLIRKREKKKKKQYKPFKFSQRISNKKSDYGSFGEVRYIVYKA